jgi:ppGpp synthetase/RelA/SpoT-type nucleotidyltranferase
MLSYDQAWRVVTDHLDANGDGYHELLILTNDAIAKTSLRLGEGVIFDVYSRGKKQKSKNEIKDKAKLTQKFIDKLTTTPDYKVEYIVDVVGITVVVFYNDQIELFIDSFSCAAKDSKLYLETQDESGSGNIVAKIHKEKGYHATHLRVRSHFPKLKHLRLEIQVKTMLHDAWGAKMHDLTYKPVGRLDPKLAALMESFGDSLQAIEVQSEALRDAIQSRVGLVNEWRKAARIQLMAKLDEQQLHNELATEKYKKCLEMINNNRQYLSNCSSRDDVMVKMTSAIEELKSIEVDAFVRLKLVTYLASLRDDTDLAGEVKTIFDEWAQNERDEVKKIWVKTAALHQTNRLAEAIEILRNATRDQTPTPATAALWLNLANYILESSLSRSGDLSLLRQEVQAILARLEGIIAQPNSTASDGALKSTKVGFLVVFGDETELVQGLDLCDDTIKTAAPEGRGYCELYRAYGWQRKLRM